LYVYTESGFAPYEYLSDDAEVVGVDIDIMNAIGEELGYKVVVNDVGFNTIPSYVQGNANAVAAAGMTKKADRDAIMAASISYATSVQYVISTTELATDANNKVSLSALAGKKIGTQEATTGFYLVDDAINEDEGALKDTNATVYEYKNAVVAKTDLGSSIDAIVIDKLPAQMLTQGTSFYCYELDEEPESYVLYLNKDNTALLEAVNGVLSSLIEQGKIEEFTINHSTGI
jgi:polar amino acid transport system substrate-binding protein